MNQRLDVRDVKGKWLEAQIVELSDTYFKIHYKGWAAKFDEFIPLDQQGHLLDTKFAEIGLYSLAYGGAKFNSQRK